MAAALLAKLKINKPPVAKQLVEINIKGLGDEPTLLATDAPKKLNLKPKEDLIRPLKAPLTAVKIIDDSMKANFDRDTFLKNFQRPKIVNTLVVPKEDIEKVPMPMTMPMTMPIGIIKTKKNVTRKLNIKPSKVKFADQPSSAAL